MIVIHTVAEFVIQVGAVTAIVVFVAAVIEARIQRGLGLTRTLVVRADELHHEYVGALLVVIGCFLALWVAAIGLALMIDDAYQHYRQVFGEEPLYQSRLHQLYGWFYGRFAFIRNLNRWLDEHL
jgi:hypothetical protein